MMCSSPKRPPITGCLLVGKQANSKHQTFQGSRSLPSAGAQLFAILATQATHAVTIVNLNLPDPAMNGRGAGLILPRQTLYTASGSRQRYNLTLEFRRICRGDPERVSSDGKRAKTCSRVVRVPLFRDAYCFLCLFIFYCHR